MDLRMAYQVFIADGCSIITDEDSDLKVQVCEKAVAALPENMGYCLATLYRIKGGFIPEKVFLFRALTDIGLEELKRTVDFFFLTRLATALYIKEVPQDSSYFQQEALRLYGKKEE